MVKGIRDGDDGCPAGPESEGPPRVGCDSIGIVPGVDPVLPDPTPLRPFSGWGQTYTIRVTDTVENIHVCHSLFFSFKMFVTIFSHDS